MGLICFLLGHKKEDEPFAYKISIDKKVNAKVYACKRCDAIITVRWFPECTKGVQQ